MTYGFAQSSLKASVPTAIGAGVMRHSDNQSFGNAPSEHSHSEGNIMSISRETVPRNFHGERGRNKRRVSTNDFSDWLKDQLRDLSAKEIAEEAGCGVRAAENVKQGRNNFTSAHQAALFMNRPDLAAKYMEYIGLLLPGQAETAAAYTKFANAAVRARSVHE